jgi:hypothetical protein
MALGKPDLIASPRREDFLFIGNNDLLPNDKAQTAWQIPQARKQESDFSILPLSRYAPLVLKI